MDTNYFSYTYVKKQVDLVEHSLDVLNAAEILLLRIKYLHPELSESTDVARLNNLCAKYTKKLYSKEGETNE